MNKILLVIFCLTAFLTLNALASAALDSEYTQGTINVYWDETNSSSFVLSNTNDTYSVTNIVCSVSGLASGLSVTFSNCPSELAILSSQIVNFSVSSQVLMPGSHDATIRVNGSLNDGNTIVFPTDSFTLPINVKRKYCESGVARTDLKTFDVKEPDSGDNFDAGSVITIEVDVEANDDMDIIIDAELYDVTTDDVVEDTSLDFELSEDEEESLDIELRIPYDIDTDHEYILTVKAYEDGNEEEECEDASIKLDIEKKSHSVVITKKTLSQNILSCGSALDTILRLANAGTNDEDVKVRIYNSALGVDVVKSLSIDEDESASVQMSVPIPRNISEGNYTFITEVYYNFKHDVYEDVDRDSFSVQVKGSCTVTPPTTKEVLISTQQLGSALSNQEFTIRIGIMNNGNAATTYSLKASGYESWANFVKLEPSTLALDSNSIGYATLVLKPFEDATGTNSFKVYATFDGTTKEQDVAVNIRTSTESASFSEKLNFGFGSWIFIIDIVLVVIVVVLIVLYTKKSRKLARHDATEISLRTVNNKKPKRK